MTSDRKTPSDAAIGAWIDGEMDKDGAAQMADRTATDETLAARAERLRRIDALVRAAVPEDDTIPDALLDRLGLAEPAPSAQIVDFAAARAARQQPPRPAAGRHSARPVPGAAMRERRPERRPERRWVRIAAQLTLVAGIGLGLAMLNGGTGPAPAPGAAPYRTLSNAPDRSTPANGLVVFAPGIDAARARAIAGAAGARLLGEPNAAGAWKLALPTGRRDAVLATLRAHPDVAMAEPIDTRPSEGGQP